MPASDLQPSSFDVMDWGGSCVKARSGEQSATTKAEVAACNGHSVTGLTGLRARRRPMKISLEDGAEYYVGAGAHDLGRPVEDLDLERLTGTQTLHALLCAALSQLHEHQPPASARLIVGLPIVAVSGETALATIQQVKAFLTRTHRWKVDGHDQETTVSHVVVTGQPVGALFEYLLDDAGGISPARKDDFKQEIGVVNVGMTTVDLLVSRENRLVERLTAGATLGVQDMLNDISRLTSFTLAELDEKLRGGQLDLGPALPAWERRVFGFVDKVWGNDHKRFARVVATGGGTYLLEAALLRKFKARLYIAADRINATVTGLHRLGLKANTGSK
jgi:hypothetical protein